MESTSAEDVKIIEMTRKDLESITNLVDKVAEGFERIDFNFERCSTVSKILSNNIICESKSQLIQQTSRCLILRNSHSHLIFDSYRPGQSAAVSIKAGTSTSEKAFDSLKA